MTLEPRTTWRVDRNEERGVRGIGRMLRIYGKKRGDRRTGDNRLAWFGETAFFAAAFGVGCISLAIVLASIVWPEFRANRHFAEATCTILDKRIERREEDGRTSYRPQIFFRYEVDGEQHECSTYEATERFYGRHDQAEKILAGFELHKQYECWYDPYNPAKAVLRRGYSGGLYLVSLIPLAFIVVGGGGLIYRLGSFNHSAERRAALAQAQPRLDLFESQQTLTHGCPNVPDDAELRSSPGIRLAYRLPVASGPGWMLTGMLVLCLFWHGITAVFLGVAIRSFLDGDADRWLTLLILLPFLAACGLLAYLLVRKYALMHGLGPVQLEIASHPLYPGASTRLFLAQPGRLFVRRLQVNLICDERATYRQGTDTRSDVRRVHGQTLLERVDIEVQPGSPWEEEFGLTIPDSAMHSLKADHNEVRWRLVVQTEVEGWPACEREFPLVVVPRGAVRP